MPRRVADHYRIDVCHDCAHRGRPRTFDEGDLYCSHLQVRHGHAIARIEDRESTA